MKKDARKQERVDCDIILNKVEDGKMNVCRAENISLGGMRIERVLEPKNEHQQTFRLQFELPGQSEPIWVGAESVYEAEDHVGVRFTSISHRHFLLLREWLSDGSFDNAPPHIQAKA